MIMFLKHATLCLSAWLHCVYLVQPSFAQDNGGGGSESSPNPLFL